MKKLFSGRVRLLLSLGVVVAILYAVISAIFGATWLGRTVQTLLTPLRSGVSAITKQVERYYNYVFEYETLQAENEYLKSRIAALEEEMRSADALERENERLKEALNLSEEHIDYEFCAAYIVSWESSNWKSTFTINKGSSAGLEKNMIAVTQLGQVVGIVTELGSNWAQITTVMDSSMEISASISSSGYTGVVQGSYTTGETGKLRLSYLPSDAILRNNDQVVTTGSTVYPKDLILGYIEDAGFDETGVSKYATLTPAADFNSLEQIFIITQYNSEG